VVEPVTFLDLLRRSRPSCLSDLEGIYGAPVPVPVRANPKMAGALRLRGMRCLTREELGFDPVWLPDAVWFERCDSAVTP